MRCALAPETGVETPTASGGTRCLRDSGEYQKEQVSLDALAHTCRIPQALLGFFASAVDGCYIDADRGRTRRKEISVAAS